VLREVLGPHPAGARSSREAAGGKGRAAARAREARDERGLRGPHLRKRVVGREAALADAHALQEQVARIFSSAERLLINSSMYFLFSAIMRSEISLRSR